MDRPAADAAPHDDPATPDDEQTERLARAASEVVHQPADPRLEKAFGHLGLFPEPETSPPPQRPARPDPAATGSVVPAAPPIDLEPLRAELIVVRATVERLERRLGTVVGLLALVAAMVLVVAVLVIVRG